MNGVDWMMPRPRSRSWRWWSVVVVLAMTGLLHGGIAKAQESRVCAYLLLDASSSMNAQRTGRGSWLDAVKQQLPKYVDSISDGTRVKFLTFDRGQPRLVLDRVVADAADRRAIADSITRLKADGQATHMCAAIAAVLSDARREFEKDRRTEFRVLVYTDGEDNDPESGTDVAGRLNRILTSFPDLRLGDRLPLTYVTLGFPAEAGLRRVIEAAGGQVVSAADPEDLLLLAADFGCSPAAGERGKPIQFFDRSTGLIAVRTWAFGDGASSSESAPVHAYAKAGRYEVVLEVRDRRGRTATTRRMVEVSEPEALVAGATVRPERGRVGESIQFFNESRGGIRSVSWDFGDGASSTEQNPVHRYSRPGSYPVRLRVTGDGREATSEVAKVEVVAWERPKADFVVPQQVLAGEPFRLADSSAGRVDRRAWTVPGATIGADETHPTVVLKEPGEYDVALEVSGPGGTDKVVKKVKAVSGLVPGLAVSNADPVVGEVVVFTDVSQGAIERAVWQFGTAEAPVEVQYGATPNPAARLLTRKFDVPGEVTVNLRVSGKGREGSSSVVVRVKPAAPVADFSFRPDPPEVGKPVEFRNKSTGPSETLTWTFGDGSSPMTTRADGPDGGNAKHAFEAAGEFAVTLEATGPGGLSRKTATVNVPSPEAIVAKVEGPGEAVAGVEVTFTDASLGSPTEATWNFGDGTEPVRVVYAGGAGSRVVRHQFAREGEYAVSVAVSGRGGRSTSPALPVRVSARTEKVVCKFSFTPGEGQGPTEVTFQNETTGTVTKYTWDFGDGSPPVTVTARESIKHLFTPDAYPKTYAVTLRADPPGGLAGETFSATLTLQAPPPPPGWWDRNWWLVVIGLILMIAGGVVARRRMKRLRLEKQARTLRGRVDWRKRADPTAEGGLAEAWSKLADIKPQVGTFEKGFDSEGVNLEFTLKVRVASGNGAPRIAGYDIELFELQPGGGKSSQGKASFTNLGETVTIGGYEFRYLR